MSLINNKAINIDKDFCTGCSACANICPVDAISMLEDDNGFYKPVIDSEKCVNCGKCSIACPLSTELENKNNLKPKLYVFNNYDESSKLSATAGGFQILAKNFLNCGGKVVGAAWNEKWTLEQVLVENETDLVKLLKSKYVQSYSGDIYKRVKYELENGIKILFSGLPCQIAGLYGYLGKHYENLYTVDLLCNNAPSAGHFRKFLDEKFGIENVKNIDFRFKPKDGIANEMRLKITLNNGTSFEQESWNVCYYQTFVKRMLAGVHCENCHFAKFPRIADITLGDIFGAEAYDNRFRALKSQSVIVNSQKGEVLFNIIKSKVNEIKEIPLKVVINMHPVLAAKWAVHPLRDRLFELIKKFPFEKACKYVLEDKYDVGVVGVPTNPNYGGGLTYLALKWVLEDMGKTVLLISPPGPDLSWLPKHITNFKNNPYKDYELACYPTKNAMRELNFKCDMFLCGSDQLYSTHFGDCYSMYHTVDEFAGLDWVWDTKTKSAYSASFGSDDLPASADLKNRMSYFLNKFDNFSVRERSAVDLCVREFGFKPEFVLDPVFICGVKRWKNFIKNAQKPEGIATYIFDKNDEANRIVSYVSEKLKLKVNILEDACFRHDEAIKMEDWLSTIDSSEFFVTDSFHGLCFAIILNKPFIVIINKGRGPARFALLKEFGLENRLVYSIEDFEARKDELLEPIDWKDVNKRMEELRAKSIEILKKAVVNKSKTPSDFDILNEKIIKIEEDFDKRLSDITTKLEYNKVSFKQRLFSKTRSLDNRHRIIRILGITIKQKRKGY